MTNALDTLIERALEEALQLTEIEEVDEIACGDDEVERWSMAFAALEDASRMAPAYAVAVGL